MEGEKVCDNGGVMWVGMGLGCDERIEKKGKKDKLSKMEEWEVVMMVMDREYGDNGWRRSEGSDEMIRIKGKKEEFREMEKGMQGWKL